MHEAETLTGLANELRALSGRQRRAILAALSPYEQAQVGALIDATTLPASVPAAAPDYSRFSPWLTRHLSADAGNIGDRNLTAATRRLLSEAAAEVAPASSRRDPEPEPKRRSLAEAVGQWLSHRKTFR